MRKWMVKFFIKYESPDDKITRITSINITKSINLL